MTLASLIQSLSDQRIALNTTERGHWMPLWRLLSVQVVNDKPVITNRPY